MIGIIWHLIKIVCVIVGLVVLVNIAIGAGLHHKLGEISQKCWQGIKSFVSTAQPISNESISGEKIEAVTVNHEESHNLHVQTQDKNSIKIQTEEIVTDKKPAKEKKQTDLDYDAIFDNLTEANKIYDESGLK